MSPAFIADSDDESEGHGFSPPPAAQLDEARSFASTKSDPASLATSSTDPVFFQGVYREQQIAAAREQQLRDGTGVHLQSTAPAGTEQTDPVSLPSQYPDNTPLTVGDGNRIFAVDSTTATGKMTGHGAVGAADPYAFPSSPEQGPAGDAGHEVWMANGSSVAYRETWDTGRDENMRPPSRKRQRLNSQAHDNVDSSLPPTAPPLYSSVPPTMPPADLNSTLDASNADVAGMLAPTMSISNDPSLVIHPRGLTSSQKEEYVAVVLPASSNPERQAEYEELPNTLLPQPSAASEHQKTPKSPSPSKEKRAKQRVKKKLSEAAVTESIQLGTPERTQEDKPAMVLADSEDEGYEAIDTPAANEGQPEDDIYEMQPSPVKPAKKKRGRPKKQKEETPIVQTEPMEENKTGKTGKKRGRPKKSEAILVEEEEVAGVNADEKPTIAGEDDKAEDRAQLTIDTKVEDATTAGATNGDDERQLEAPVVTAKETPRKPAARGAATPQQGSAGKPLYRIGLSKRSRIAPLLKSLPK
ncbi:hypothetical protein PWT90_10872 [Aphanocladium album]|nr:hypothetical protein PWT90_10872 [Aphanocladium album]